MSVANIIASIMRMRLRDINKFRTSDDYFPQTLKMARSLSPRVHSRRFFVITRVFVMRARDEALLVFKVGCNPCTRAE